VFLAQAQTAQSVFKAAMVNIGDEQRFYTDSITVDFEVISREPIREVTFNGDALDIIPARSSFVVSRAFPLFNEPARFDLRLEAENERGETAVDEKVIYRELNEVELDVSKLSMVFVQPENQHPDIDEAGVTQILNWLQDSGPYRNRFARAKVRLDSVLDAMLDEYELMALEEGEEQLDRSQERIADLIITTLIKGGEDFVEIIMRGYSVDQQVEITDRVEVADGFEDGVTLDKLRPLVETLATRLVQEFPRVQAPVYDVRGARVAFGLTSDDGIREFYKCLLVQRTTETVGDFVSETYETQGIGFCEVPRSQNFSWGTFTWAGSFAEGASDTDLGEYTVVTK
jgi:hypothetical protein